MYEKIKKGTSDAGDAIILLGYDLQFEASPVFIVLTSTRKMIYSC